MRCSTDHHNVLVQQVPLAFLHRTSWQVNDVDEIGRGATARLLTRLGRDIATPDEARVMLNLKGADLVAF
jgi:hypothetical protein